MVALPDWSYRADYIATRSSRRPGDTDILPAWADEALSDPEAVVIEPDYASRSGRSVRTIGMSFSAGFVITVITVVDEGRTWGVNAWRSSEADIRHYLVGN